jgi:putative two-component system response regulator
MSSQPMPNLAELDVSRARILVVDDEEGHVLLLRRLLRSAGYGSVCTTTDPTEAAELYRVFHPDLVLLDLFMQPLDGFQVLEQLKAVESDSYANVVMITAQGDQQAMVRALEAGARDFLRKPYDRVEALTRIRNALEVRLLNNLIRDQNRRLEETVRERTRELRETRLEVVRRLGRAAEYRDNDTGQHIMRMSLMAARLGRAAGLTEEHCELLLTASPMHDVGKIGIPDRVLLKNGPLDGEEWAVMQQHPSIGAEILSGSRSELIQMAEQIAHCHHEKWDGTGYPRKLRGEEIPLAARICAICDVFDALLSDRPYKSSWSVAEAVAELERRRGRDFDPRLVDLFKAALDDMLAIRELYADQPAQPRAAAENGRRARAAAF